MTGFRIGRGGHQAHGFELRRHLENFMRGWENQREKHIGQHVKVGRGGFLAKNSHRVHGTGILTYMNG